MDEVDSKIVAILRERGNESNTEIAKKVGLSEAAVRKRISNMIGNGTIKRFTVELGSKDAVRALVLISVDPHHPMAKICEKIVKVQGVSTLYEITGNYDIAAVLEGQSAESINDTVDEIRNLEHVEGTDTRIILRKWK